MRHLDWVLRGITRLMGWWDENKSLLSEVEYERISTALFIVVGEFIKLYRDHGTLNQDLLRYSERLAEKQNE